MLEQLINQQIELEVNHLHALIYNDTEQVIRYIDLGANANLPVPKGIYDPFAKTSLTVITEQTLGELDKGYSYPIHIAAQKSNKRLLNVLLRGKADIEAKSSDGLTALALAVKQDNAAMVKHLLAKGANPNTELDNGNTSLHYACYGGNIMVVSILISYKSNINKADDNGETPLIIAIMTKKLKLVKLLIENQVNVNQAKPSGASPLFMAAQIGALEIVKILLAAGADVQASRLTDGCSPLQIAATKGHMKVVEALVKAGADLSYKDMDDKTAAMLANEQGFNAIAAYLNKTPSKMIKSAFFKAQEGDHLAQAKQRYSQKQYNAAIYFFQKAIPAQPLQNKAPLLCNIGHCYFALKNYELAVGYYTNAIAASPENTAFYSWRAKAYKKQAEMEGEGSHDKAVLLHRASLDENTAKTLKECQQRISRLEL